MRLWRRRAESTPTPAEGSVGRVGLVGCVKDKGTAIAPAKDLYVSPLFRGRRRYVERSCAAWFILSAKHHLVRPEQSLAPYDESLKNKSRAEIRLWSGQVLDALDALGLDYRRTVFEIHAGDEYRSFGLVDGLLTRGARVEVPAAGLSLGRQLALYAAGGRTAPPVQKDTDAYAVRTAAVGAAFGSMVRSRRSCQSRRPAAWN
jgi:hypothetical protein